MRILAVIPARFASTRFPGKPLADRTGKPLIQHVVERVREAKRIGRIVVATDDDRIAAAVARFGGEAMMTGEHPNGTSRIAEVVERLGTGAGEVIVNVQGDEPEIEPDMIDALVEALAGGDAAAPMATVATPLGAGEDAGNPNVVKVVVDAAGRALYFSRSPIPCHRDGHGSGSPPYLKHLGLYAYRRDFLLRYARLAETPLELAEKLEQLRALEHGHAIRVIVGPPSPPGIDTPEQYDAFVARTARL